MNKDCDSGKSPVSPVRPCDIKGILHSHTRWTDGAHSLASMVETARDIGLDYLGVSDHFVSETQKDGLDLDAARVQRQEVARLQEKLTDFTIFQGIEVDVNRDGTLPVDDEALDFFDYVIAAFPDLGDNCKEAFVDRVVVAAENPRVTILGTPVGDHMLRSCEGMSAMRRVLDAAVKHGKAVELDASPNCPEIDWSVCRLAQEMGVFMVISPNAHRAARIVDFRHGAQLAHDAGLICEWILNTKDSGELRSYLGL